MSDEGTSFTIDLPVRGQAQIDAASASMNTLAAQLEGASKATIASSEGVKAAEAAYRKAEQSADNAAKALERVGLAADVQRGKLRAATEATDDKAAERAAAKLRDLVIEQEVLADRAAKSKKALDEQAASLDKLGKGAEKVEKESKGEGIEFEGISRGLGKLGGPLAEAGKRVAELGAGFGKLTRSLGSAGPYVAAAVLVAALATALLSAGAAAIFATAKILEWSVGLADANRNTELLSEGIARSVAGGQQLNDKVSDLTKKLPLTREELNATAQKLAEAGYRGKALTDALQTSAIAAAKLKFGPNFQDEMLSLDEQSKVFHENLAEIFGGLKIDGLLAALQKLIGLFDASTESGRAIKVVFESIFQPLVDGLEKAEPKIERFFLQLEVWALKALILFKPHASLVLKIGEAFAIVAAIIGGVVVTAIGIVAAALAAPLVVLTSLVFAVIEFKDKVLAAFDAVKAFFSTFSLADMGKAMIDGLVKGIESGGAAILGAMKGAVMGAVDGAKKLLGIASPSKVLEAEVGMMMGAGAAKGIDKSAGQVQGSLENMLSPTAPGTGAPAASASTAGGKSGASISGNTFILQGVKDAEDAEARIGALLTRLLEGDATQLGAAIS